MKWILMLFLAATLFGGEDNPLPPGVVKKINTFNKRVEALEKSFLTARQKEVVKIKIELEREVKNITKKGDLDGALAVKKILEQLVEMGPKTDILGNKIEKPTELKLGRYLFRSITTGFEEYWFIQKAGVWKSSETRNLKGTYAYKDDLLTIRTSRSEWQLKKTEEGLVGEMTRGGSVGHKQALYYRPE